MVHRTIVYSLQEIREDSRIPIPGKTLFSLPKAHFLSKFPFQFMSGCQVIWSLEINYGKSTGNHLVYLVEISEPILSQYMTLTANCSTHQQRSINKLQPHQNKVNLKLLQITNYISDQKSKGKPLYFYYSMLALT